VLIVLLLFAVALAAGFVDAIAGGGGLLTVPALLACGLPPHLALGTNKAQSMWGSGAALLRYYHSPLLDRRRVMASGLSAFIGSLAGTAAVSVIAPGVLRPLILVLLTAVAVFMVFYKPPAAGQAKPVRVFHHAALVALAIGAYDGFFGPGTGTFLILAYVLFWHEPLDQASANAKVANFASNVASFTLFALLGSVSWGYAAPMAAGQLLGGWAGAHVTVRRGVPLVRLAVLAVSLALITRLAWQMVME
jgi:uncharacterized membrane protein YfcA